MFYLYNKIKLGWGDIFVIYFNFALQKSLRKDTEYSSPAFHYKIPSTGQMKKQSPTVKGLFTLNGKKFRRPRLHQNVIPCKEFQSHFNFMVLQGAI